MVKGWKKEKLGDIGNVHMCKRIFSYQTSQNDSIPFYKIGTFGKKADTYISYRLFEDYKQKYSFPTKGDVLLSASGTIGKKVVYDGKDAYFQDSNIVWLKIDKNKISNEYLYHYYSVINWTSAEGTTISRLYNDIIESSEINYPTSTTEQKIIATALSDMDEYISALEKLIAKKQAIKQGAMEELLTGKRRLAGFDGEWVEKILDDVVLFYDNLRKPVPESQRPLGSTPYYGANGIQSYISGYTHIGEFVLLAEDGANDLKNYPIIYTSGKIWVNNHTHVIQGREKQINTKFLSYVLNTVDFIKILVGGTRSKLNASVAKNIILLIPSLTEQTAIAEILSDMDAEIEALQEKLKKARNIKKGMMHELLTGNIRLVEDIEEKSPKSKIIAFPKTEESTRTHSKQFDDAVMLAGIVHALYSEKYPIGRVRLQKCLYLLRRHQSESVEAFKKKAAGPYADEVRYKGGEPIAIKNGYISASRDAKGTVYALGKNIEKALGYIEQWDKTQDIQWVVDKLKFIKRNDLELLATVDMAICDLEKENIPVSVDTIKHLIATNNEWKAKLKKDFFSDEKISQAIKQLRNLFGGNNA